MKHAVLYNVPQLLSWNILSKPLFIVISPLCTGKPWQLILCCELTVIV